MTSYTVTTADWNDTPLRPSFGAGSGGDRPEFSLLQASFGATADPAGIVSTKDGATGVPAGMSGDSRMDTNLNRVTPLDFFTPRGAAPICVASRRG